MNSRRRAALRADAQRRWRCRSGLAFSGHPPYARRAMGVGIDERRWASLAARLAVTGAILVGCHPAAVDPGELIVVTARDPDLDDASLSTFGAPAEVFDLTGTGVVPSRPAEGFEDDIVDGFRGGFLRKGWRFSDDPDAPDVDALLLVGVVASESFLWVGSPGWSYYPGWGQIFPAEWPSATVPRGSVVAILVDPRDADPNVRALRVRWGAILQSVFARDAEHARARLLIALGIAFAQSPYLERDAEGRDATTDANVGSDAGLEGDAE